MIEKNHGLFFLKHEDKYLVCYGHHIQSEINEENIRNTFFSNLQNYELNKNYKLFCKFEFIKIYFYMCYELI